MLVGAPRTALALAALSHPTLPLTQAALPGQMVKAPDMTSDAEVLRFTDDLLPNLLQVRAGQEVRLAEWPVAPGVRRDVLVTRHELYAPGARIFLLDAAGSHEVPRSRLVFFWGTEADNSEVGLSFSVDPVSGAIESLTQTAFGSFQLRQLDETPGLYTVAGTDAIRAGAGLPAKPAWRCGAETMVPLPRPAEDSTDAAGSAARNANLALTGGPAATTDGAAGGHNLATVAFDVDSAFLAKYSNNTTQVTSYLASLVAATNVMYERDLNVQLLIGTTLLRTTATDPYTTQPDPNANVAQLNEFTTYWGAHYASTPRTVAALISGKETDSALSGIAWVSGLCSTSYGYSVNDIMGGPYIDYDQLILGHELGHNFGSAHTHCYSPPIDHCYSGESSSCYNGPTSCPAPSTVNGVASVTGTMMSYCDLLGGCGVAMVFHPRVVTQIQTTVTPALGVCMSAGGTGGTGVAFYTAAPCRVLDTRNAAGPEGGPALSASQQRTFQITGKCGIPTNATAVSINSTVIGGGTAGSISLYAGNTTPGTGTSAAWGPGQIRAANATVQLATDGTGTIGVQNNSTSGIQFILDVNGYYK